MNQEKKQLNIEIKEREPHKTPLYENHLALKAKIVNFAGWLMPIYYTNITDEHLIVRRDVGIFDISHMGEIEITGKDAYSYLQKMIANDLHKIGDGQIIYTPLCNHKGGVIDDLLVYKINQEKFFLVVNASNTHKDYQWLCENIGEEEVEIKNLSQAFGAIAVQGPKTASILEKVFKKEFNVNELKYYHFIETTYQGEYCLISRTGYTGEDGFEIYYQNIKKIWEAFLKEGKEYQLKPIGLGARDTLRLEMAYSLYGHDLTEQTTPLESGIGWTVALHKKNFIGKKAIKQKKTNLNLKLVGFELTQKGVPRQHCLIKHENKKIGEVSSGTFSPTLKKGIGLGFVNIEQAETGKLVEIEIRGKNIPAKIVKPPFYKKNKLKGKN